MSEETTITKVRVFNDEEAKVASVLLARTLDAATDVNQHGRAVSLAAAYRDLTSAACLRAEVEARLAAESVKTVKSHP